MGGSDKDEEEDGKMEERKLKTSFLWYGKREPTCRAIDSAMLSGGRRIPLLSPPPPPSSSASDSDSDSDSDSTAAASVSVSSAGLDIEEAEVQEAI